MQQHCRSVIRNRGWVITPLLMLFTLRNCSILAQPVAPPEIITLCDLIKNPVGYRGRVVAVVGVYWYGLRDVCSSRFITASHTWPSAIELAHSGSNIPNDIAVPFQTDEKSWDHLQSVVLQEARAARKEEIWVTAVGIVQAPASYIDKAGQVVGGYGHLGVFPAQLVIESISQIRIVKKPTYNYGEILRQAK